ncbi:MAG: AgmX/PglI C-terminal domain-containing protein [Polyangiaceae bacterium]
MPETTPPIPKSGGSGPFILAAIVMLLLMGGLIYWKTRASGTETAKVETQKPSVTADQPALDEPPPPPPPPVASADASAAPDATKPGAKKVASTGGGNMCGECTGEPNPGLQAALSGKAGQSRGCYEKALSMNATLSGRMTVSLKINQQGSVCSASVKSDLGNPLVEGCVLQSFRGATFPAPKGGCVDAVVPLYFKPKT